MFNWLKNRTEPVRNDELIDVKTAPGTLIQYSPELLLQLTKEHRQLLILFGEIRVAFQRGDYKKTVQKINEFRSLFQAHLLIENVRLYIYLERSFADDATNYELIRGLRREMDNIARTALAFLDKYEAIGVDKDVGANFSSDIEAVGEILMRRVDNEENTLYQLYLISHHNF